MREERGRQQLYAGWAGKSGVIYLCIAAAVMCLDGQVREGG
jgi:hypothetical protein